MIQVDDVYDELVGVDGFNPKFRERVFREVLEVCRDDPVASANDCCRKNVTIIFIGQLKSVDERMIMADLSVREMARKGSLEVLQFFLIDIIAAA